MKGNRRPGNREEKTKALLEKLEEGVKAVFDSEQYKNYLSAMSRFHSYSFNNTLLICMQKPDASLVAGFKTWESLGRHVKKGETGIAILAPCPYRSIKEMEAVDLDTGEVRLDAQGNPIKEKREISYLSFRPATVFDISQTEGKELPSLAEELKGEAENYAALMDAVRQTSPFLVRFDTWEGSKKGYCSPANREIVIKSGMSEMQTVKTAIHDTAHSILHIEHQKEPASMEVEAESIAYVVCQHFGLDTSDYSFGYLAGWSSGKELPELKASLQIIQKTANHVIEHMESRIQNYTNNLDISRSLEEEPREIPGLADTSLKHRKRR